MLVERSHVLEEISELVDESHRSSGRLILLSGEAGIGKTTILEYLTRSGAGEWDPLWGYCDPLSTPRTLGPIQDMASGFDATTSEQLNRGNTTTGLFPGIIHQLAKSKVPRVLIIEDAHWADQATLDFIKYVGRRIRSIPTAMIITFRSDEVVYSHPLSVALGDVPVGNTRRIELEPLTISGVETLLARANPQSNDLELAQKVFEISHGNPLFATELINSTTTEKLNVPASIKDSVAARLDRLISDDVGFLHVISHIPTDISKNLINTLFPGSGEKIAINCVEKRFLYLTPKGKLRFRHELVRLAVQSMTGASEQRATHGKILNALMDNGSEEYLEQIVHHAAQASKGEIVMQFAQKAAQRASQIGAHREAAAHLKTAMQFVGEGTPEEVAQLYEDWSYESGLVKIDDEVVNARRHAASLWRALERPEKIAHNLRWLSRLHWYRGEAADALRYSEKAIELYEDLPPSADKAMAYSYRSQLYMLHDEMDEAVDWGNKALAMEEQFPDDEVRVHALNNIGTAQAFRGIPEGFENLSKSLILALDHDLHEHAARVYTNLSECAIAFKDFPLAEKTLNDGISFDTKHDLDSWTYYLVGRQAELRLLQGRLDEAEVIASGVLELEHLTLLMQLPALSVLAFCRMRRGAADATALLEQMFINASATEEAQHLIPGLFGLIEHYWLRNESHKARRYFDQLLLIDRKKFDTWDLGDLLVWGKRCAVDIPEELRSSPIPEACELELNGNIAGSAQCYEGLDMPYHAALTLFHISNDDAETALNRARNNIQPLGCLPLLEKIDVRAREIKITLDANSSGQRSDDSNPLGLTKKEIEILRLLATGASNKEISTAFSRSPRTIEHHVSHILAKMNVPNRMEALLRIQNEPWLVPQ